MLEMITFVIQVLLTITILIVKILELTILSGMDKDVDYLTLAVQFLVAATRVHHGSSSICLQLLMIM